MYHIHRLFNDYLAQRYDEVFAGNKGTSRAVELTPTVILQNFTDLHFGLSKYNPSIAYSEGAFLDMNCGEYFKKLKAYTNTINREIESYEKKK